MKYIVFVKNSEESPIEKVNVVANDVKWESIGGRAVLKFFTTEAVLNTNYKTASVEKDVVAMFQDWLYFVQKEQEVKEVKD